ncbi:hypothetical protein ES754_06375 [Psychrobacter frigidicola]|uniref:Uncharacterized protein n=1 Tax=Psychrobacter frigidicola TaxID=45611 RepID=A0A5C7A5E2_9GAMM|nr:hypothetical protein [Psychrobacter frigidicola]TXD98522.1 hypothetical protein ES754_06375 [Psychrobacter frigidicola]
MSSFLENSQSNLKKVLRTALVGLKPADQVLLKGYLRVLLRLEADLEWVSASHPQVDLFMISNEFRDAASITKLLASQQHKPVLYVSRTDIGEGWMVDDSLVLPLKKLDMLNAWLMQSVIVLKQNAGAITTILQQNQIVAEKLPVKQTQTSNDASRRMLITKATTTAQTQLNNSTPASSVHVQDYQGLITFIQQLQQRPTGLHQIVIHANTSSQTIAIIEPRQGRVWLPQTSADSVLSALSLDWQLQPYQGTAPSDSGAYDLTQWLWEQAWRQATLLLPLINDDSTYQLRYWIKPTLIINNESTGHSDLTKNDRQELLRVMTALSSTPRDVNQLASIAKLSIKSTKKIIGSLLFSGSLQADSYKQLDIRLTHLTNTAPPSSVLPNITSIAIEAAETATEAEVSKGKQTAMEALLARRARCETIPNAPSSSVAVSNSAAMQELSTQTNSQPPSAQQEKRGFLARLRQKLGL